MGLRLFGLLQPSELALLDHYFRLRPPEPLDPRIVIVGITQQDISTLIDYPLTDEILAQLLEKIRQQQPRAIGLDIYRDLPVPAQKGDGYKKLTSVFETTPNLVGVEKVMGSGNDSPISPPPALVNSGGLVGANDIINDPDRVIRRAVLYTPKPNSRTDPIPTLGLVLADLYLQSEKGIDVQWIDKFTLKYNSVKLTRLSRTDGGYVDVNDSGYQILLNYKTPPHNFKLVTTVDVLEGRIEPDLFRDRIVLIGNVNPDWKDFFSTPFTSDIKNSSNSDNINDKCYGVFLQANIVSSIVSAVLDERPLLETWSEWQELIWISLWSLIGLICVWRLGHKKILKLKNFSSQDHYFFIGSFLICTFLGFIVYVITLLAFIREVYWLPIVPPWLGIFTAFILGTRAIYVLKLERVNQNLEKRIADRTAQLRRAKEATEERNVQLKLAKEALEAASISKDFFFANITHELRTPLNSILGYVDLMQRDTNLYPSQVEDLQIIRDSGTHLLTLINNILDLSKSTAGKMELNPKSIHLQNFLDGIIGLAKMWAKEKGILLILDTDSQLPTQILADETKLRQVLINLLSNAVKFTDSGKVVLKVSASEHFQQSLRGEMPQHKLRFEVIDTGAGMNPQQVQKIFKPFEQVGDVRSRSAGTGLGLALSKQLVELMGGSLMVKSRPSAGSTFWFDINFPAVEMAAIEQIEESKPTYHYQGKYRQLLIVDDEKENRDLLLKILQPIGFKLETATNGQEMLSLAYSKQPDLILFDLFMSQRTSLTSVKELLEKPEIQNIPIIIITASFLSKEMIHSLNCNAVLYKPINEEELLLNLQNYLQLEWMII